MTSSLRALLTGIIDYAGLFPPARLPLDDSIRNYAQYRKESDAWMLGRFICPAGKLAELEPYCRQVGHAQPTFAEPLTVSALGRGGANAAEFLEGVAVEAEIIEDFCQRQGERVQVDVFEVRLPDDVLATPDDSVKELIGKTIEILSANRQTPLRPFFEITLTDSWQSDMATVLTALRENPLSQSNANLDMKGGFKLRCGGLEAASFPTIEQVASCLHQCLAAGIAFKATAGLHHPLRRFAPDVQTEMHGFINLFGAGVLAKVHNLNEKHIQKILTDEDAGHFIFTDDHFSWGEWQATTAEIAAVRKNDLLSFGSCSFDEPHEGLRELGWM